MNIESSYDSVVFMVNHWLNILVGGWPTPLKIWKSVGMIILNIWKNKIHVPNHQPDDDEDEDDMFVETSCVHGPDAQEPAAAIQEICPHLQSVTPK